MPLTRSRRLLGTISFFLASSSANEFADVSITEKCPIQCSSPGTASCQQGRNVGNAFSPLDSLLTAKPPMLPTSLSDMNGNDSYFCLCKPGYIGSDCSIAVDSCAAATANQGGGKIVCLHGGKCREEGGCDCANAFHDGSNYAGQYCEVEIPSEAYCPSEKDVSGSESRSTYCLNGGICLSSSQDSPSCSCQSGYEGDHCEKKRIPSSPDKCNLPCRNQGVCVSSSSSNTSSTSKLQLESEDNVDGMFCQCPTGYTGILCQYQIQVCGDNEHVCFHGSRCVAGSSDREVLGSTGVSYGCECADPTDRVCKKRVEYCMPSDGHPEYFESMAVPAFCVNGGECKDVISGNIVQYGCDCPELYSGKNCEFLKSSRDIIEEARVADAEAAWEANRAAQDLRRRGFISLYILLASLAITAVAWYLRLRWRLRLSARRSRPRDFNKNLYQFRDENVGVTTANGNMMFPTFYVRRRESQDDSDEEHLILHDVEIS